MQREGCRREVGGSHVAHLNGARWHLCVRWVRLGMNCPFAGEEEEVEEGDPPDDVPPIGVPTGSPPLLLMAGRRARVSNVLAEAEEIVARAAEAIPVGVGREVASLAERLRLPGAVSAGAGVAAAFAVRQVAKKIRARGGFGGLHFPAKFDPLNPLRVP